MIRMATTSSSRCLLTLLVTLTLAGTCLGKKNSKERQHPRNITRCDSASSSMGSFDWQAYSGRWYVSYVSNPLSPTLRKAKGYAVEIEASSIEPSARDRAWRGVTAERKEILVFGDSRKCRKRSWQCRREQDSSQTMCALNGDRAGVVLQDSVVMFTDYISTAVVYRETYVNRGFVAKQINIMVRNPAADPDPAVIEQALKDYCGIYAADPNSEFYQNIPTDSDLSCFLP